MTPGAEASGEIMTHLTSGAVVVYGIQRLKAIPQLHWITQSSGVINAGLSFLAAVFIAVGITWQGDAQSGWVIHIPMLTVLTAGAWEAVKQFTLQQLLYDCGIQKSGAARPRSPNP